MKTLRWSSSILRLASVLAIIMLAFAGQHAKAQQCKPPEILTLSASTNLSKLGYPAFINPDTNGIYHYYLTKDKTTDVNIAGGWLQSPAILHGHDIRSISLPSGSEIINSADGSCSFNTFWCDGTTVDEKITGVLSNDDMWEITTTEHNGDVLTSEENWLPGTFSIGDGYDGPNDMHTNLTPLVHVDTIYTSDGNGSNVTTYTLSSEYTDAMLAANISANMPAYPTVWATNVYSAAFFLWNDTGHSSATGGKTKYFFHYDPCEKNQTYLFEWTQKTVFADTNKPPATVPFSEKVTSDGNSANGVVTSTYTIDVPVEPCTISESPATVTPVPTPSPPGSGGPGGPGPGPGPKQ